MAGVCNALSAYLEQLDRGLVAYSRERAENELPCAALARFVQDLGYGPLDTRADLLRLVLSQLKAALTLSSAPGMVQELLGFVELLERMGTEGLESVDSILQAALVSQEQ